MSWTYPLEINGYNFMFIDAGGGEQGIIVPPDADLEDEDYVEALALAQERWEYIGYFLELKYSFRWWNWQSYGDYDRAELINKAHRFLNQDMLTKPDWIKTYLDDLVKNNRPPKPVEEKKKRTKPGFVYLLKADNGYHKIGYTKDPKSRAKTFGIQLPFEVAFECLIKSDDMVKLETELHQRFADKRTEGEWFKLDKSDVEYIKGLAS